MILTLTPNPSLDRTVSLPAALQRGAVQRLTGVVMEPGGKGVNVARVLSTSGRAATAVLPAAEHDPILLALDALELPGLTVHPVPVAGAARINTAVTEPDGTTTKLNEQGAGLSEQEIEAVERDLLETLTLTGVSAGTAPHHWAVLSGSLPPG
ncbi:PfkB family carbohydrate kinase, partial [uncultured Actinomyces sp.]